MSDIDTVLVDSLKALDLERPIREAAVIPSTASVIVNVRLAAVPLHLRRKASPFWIILLLVGARSEHPMIHPAAPDRSAIALANVRFSNRPFGVKRFQTIHQHSVDVAHGLVLLFGIGAKALPSWDSKTRRNNLWDGLAVSVTAGPSGHTISPHLSSREGHHSTARWNSSFLLLD